MRSLVDRRFRTNPKFELVTVAELPSQDRTRIQSVAGDKIWAVLRCRETSSYDIAIDHETAVLFCSLLTPQTLPESLTKLTTPGGQRLVARLVCDQIIQIEKADGTFVHGVRAYHDLFGGNVESNSVRSRQLDPLSRAAIDYALALPSLSTVALARRLYSFNSSPRTQRWDTLLGDSGATARWLGLETPAPWQERVKRCYAEYGTRTGSTPWLQWIRHGLNGNAVMRHKIYVSPITKELPEVLAVVAEVCCAMDVPAFKIGITLLGVLRPDRLVVYVNDQLTLSQVAAELRFALQGFEAHGVPFTASVDPAGLLSWAIDPEPRARLWPFDEPWSWRMAVAGDLAESITCAKRQDRDEVVIDFALQRLRLDLIEPMGWRSRMEGVDLS